MLLKKIAIILVCALSIPICSNAQNNDTVNIVINSDTTIFLRDQYIPKGKYLYGEILSDGKDHGGTGHKNFVHYVTSKNHYQGIEICQNKNSSNAEEYQKGISVKILYDQVMDSTIELRFPYENRTNASDKEFFLIRLNKQANNIIANECTTYANCTCREGCPCLQGKVCECCQVDTKPAESSSDYGSWCLVIGGVVIFIILILGYFYIKGAKNKDKTKNIKNKEEDNDASQARVNPPSLKDKKDEDDKIRQIIREEVEASFKRHFENHVKTYHQPLPTLPPKLPSQKTDDDNEKPSKPEVEKIDTDDVIYYPETQTFRIENTDFKIFRIYSEGDEYFYTIVDDHKTREELVDSATSYNSCLKISDSNNSKGSRVEPIKPGRLIKEGTTYRVDTSNMLELRII